MRQERDALGDWQIEEDAFYGIATARLVSAIAIPGPAFPTDLLRNFLRVRQAQAIAFGRGKQWSLPVASALERAADRMVADEAFLLAQVRVLPLHGGGVRSLVLNLDEVLANVALLEMGAAPGDYHLLAPLFRLDRGLQSLAAYMTAFHITLLDGFARLDAAFEAALTALTLLQFCQRLRVLTGHSREIDLPRLRSNTAFSPAQHEFLFLDTISQMGFAICGADAATTAAIQCGLDDAGAYAPLFTAEILWSGQWLTASLQLLVQQLASGLTGIAEPGRLRAAASPLQAERLIPILGYERAVQVARIAALTEKPVRMVVEKMKLLSAEQLAGIFPADDEPAEPQSEFGEKIC